MFCEFSLIRHINTNCEGFFFFFYINSCIMFWSLHFRWWGCKKIHLYWSTFYFWYFSIYLLTFFSCIQFCLHDIPLFFLFFFFLCMFVKHMWKFYKLSNFQCNGSGLTVFGTIENYFPLTFNVTYDFIASD